MIGLDGSTATTATGPAGAAQLADQRRHERALAGARRPGDARRGARGRPAGRAGAGRASATGVRFSTAVSSRASARRSPARAASHSSARVAGGSAARRATLVARSGVGPEVVGDLGDRRARARRPRATPASLRAGDVVVGDDPADRDQDVVQALRLAQLADPGHERHVGAGQDRQARRRRRPPGAPPSRSSRASGGGRCRRPRSPRRAGPRASTLAPRSWPSRPGLAISTLSGRSVMAGL